MRLIDADEFFNTFPELAIEPYINTPTVEAEERKTGRWEERKVCDEPNVIEEWQSAQCSNCGLYHTTPYMYYFDNYKYCPNCGARMMETKEGGATHEAD